LRRQLSASRKVSGLVLASGAEQLTHASNAETIELVDRAQDDSPSGSHGRIVRSLAQHTDALQDTVQNLAVVDPHTVAVSYEAQSIEGIAQDHGELSVRRHGRRANGVDVELKELPEAPGSRLFVAPHRAELIAPERF